MTIRLVRFFVLSLIKWVIINFLKRIREWVKLKKFKFKNWILLLRTYQQMYYILAFFSSSKDPTLYICNMLFI